MKFTLGWLRDHLDTGVDAGGIADALTDLGLEVENLTDPAQGLERFVIGEVRSAEPHPNADRLRVCQVDTGSGLAQVVCGAPNARAGMRGVFAPPGERIPGTGMDLRMAEIRGVESCGMLLSERELGISDEHDGIVELPEDAPVGENYARYAGLDDPVFDIAVTPNRPDALGVRGIARDLAARGIGQLKVQAIEPVEGVFDSPVGVTLKPEVADRACPLFVGRYFRGVQNGASPRWMQQRLRAIGLRPISALVDITNYFTFDLCRPLHAFDADRLTGGIQVRFAKPGERLEALDGGTHVLDPEMTVIADDAGAQGLGGVVGGTGTACGPETCNVVFEAAYFDPLRTAATGRRLNIPSDARFRFERGIDPAFAIDGMEAASRMILEICGGEVSHLAVAGAAPDVSRVIPLRTARTRELVGMEVPVAEQERILEALGFETRSQDRVLEVRPPSWRPDVHGEADLVEEIARVASLADLPAVPLPRRRSGVSAPALDMVQRRTATARRLLAGRGMHECVCYSFVSAGDATRFGGDAERLRLQNPISPGLSVMRPSLLPALLQVASRNRARGTRDLAVFEVGAEFYGPAPGEQRRMASGVRMGDAVTRSWNAPLRAVDVFDVKADLLALIAALGAPADRLTVKGEAPGWYHPGRSGVLGFGPKNPVAHFGELHPEVIAAMDLEAPVAAFELRIENLPRSRGGRGRPPFEAPNYQAVERDFAFVASTDVTAAEILRAARGAEKSLIESVRIFDVFGGPEAERQLGKDRKSVAITVRLQPRGGTLEESEIGRVSEAVVAAVIQATGAELRA